METVGLLGCGHTVMRSEHHRNSQNVMVRTALRHSQSSRLAKGTLLARASITFTSVTIQGFVISEAAFAGKCPPGLRYYNGRCV